MYASSEGVRTLVVEREAIGGQAGTSSLIRNYLGFSRGLSGAELAQRGYQQAWVFGARFVVTREVAELTPQSPSGFLAQITDVGEVTARAAVISTGVSYRRLGIPSLEKLSGHGVYYGASVSAAHALIGLHAAVVGAGNSAGQAALHLARYCASVHLIVRAPNLANSMSAYLVDAICAMPVIKVHVNTEVVGAQGDGQLEEITMCDRSDGQESQLPLASLFVMIGARPRTDWLPLAVARDGHGFLFTGAEAAASDIGRCPARHNHTKQRFPDSLPLATYGPAPSNEWHQPSARGRSWSPKFTSSSPGPRRTEVTEPMRGGTRIVITAVILTVPLLGLLLLLAQPALDLRWEHHPAHFWLVLITALLSAVLAYATGDAAGRRGDARLLYVSLAFLSSAGFLGLHALSTPGVLLDKPNTGFLIATPVGLAIGSVFAALSTAEFSGDRAVRHVRIGKRLRWALLGLMVLWAVWSLASLPPLDRPPKFAERFPLWLAIPAVLLYAGSAVRYVQLWRRRPSLMLLAVPSALILLAESMVAIAFARNWHLSWWEWHVLMLLAFGLVALSARASWREERFAELYLPQTSAGDREISVLFADLEGFTSFSETHEPDEVASMLNEYFAVAVPAVVAPYGGDVDRIIGDALMVTFNKRGDQPDHAHRAAGAGLALQKATLDLGNHHPEWPRFRVGINSGHVSVSLLGAEGGRTHTIIGDTVNIASRIESTAPIGGVAIGPDTKALLQDAVTTPIGTLHLKGRQEPLQVYLLTSL